MVTDKSSLIVLVIFRKRIETANHYISGCTPETDKMLHVNYNSKTNNINEHMEK